MTQTWHRRWLAFIVIAAVMGLIDNQVVGRASASEPRAWSFSELGYPSTSTLNLQSPTTTIEVPQIAGLSQGNSAWASATIKVEVSGLEALSGTAYVEATWNGQAFIGLKLKPVRADEGSVVEWSTTDLFNGPMRGYEARDRLELALSNFPPLRAAEGGPTNQIVIRLSGEAKHVQVAVHSDSMVFVSQKGPTSLDLTKASWDKQDDSLVLDLKFENSGLPFVWMDAKSRIVLADGQSFAQSISIDEFKSDGAKVRIPVTLNQSEVAEVQLSLEYPGGAFGPVLIQERTSRWSWERVDNNIPWAILALLAFPVFWVAISNSFVRRTSNVAVLALTLSWLALTSVNSAAAEETEVLPPAEYLPRVTADQRRQVNSDIAEWLISRFQSEVSLTRGQVWSMTENNSAVAFVVIVGLMGAPEECDGTGGAGFIVRVTPQVWALQQCE